MPHGDFIQTAGDITAPRPLVVGVPIIVPHVCNDIGAWGAGLTRALTRRWPIAEQDYRTNASNQLGSVRLVPVQNCPDIYVANMIAQHGIQTRCWDRPGMRPPIRYAALAEAMTFVGVHAEKLRAEIHCPRFGSGLAGGKEEVIEQMIREVWCDRGRTVVVYEYKE